MNIITFRETCFVTLADGDRQVQGGTRYIFEQDAARMIIRKHTGIIYEMSDLEPYLLKKIPSDWHGLRVLLFRRGGIGDQVAFTAIPRWLHEQGAECHICCQTALLDVWIENDQIKGFPMPMPIAFDSVWRSRGRFFDYCFFLESVCESDNDSEQANFYDRMFELIGADDVADSYKIPSVRVPQADIESMIEFIKVLGEKFDLKIGRYMVLQTETNQIARTFPLPLIEKSLHAASEIAKSLGLHLLVVNNRHFSEEVTALIQSTDRAIDISGMIVGLRGYAALIRGAACVLGPDSSMLHYAAGFKVPALGIWGTHDPMSRARTYKNQLNLWDQSRCQRAPCYYSPVRGYDPEMPFHKCPEGLNQKHCACFDGITVEQIRDGLEALLK